MGRSSRATGRALLAAHGLRDAEKLRRKHPDLAPADWYPVASDLLPAYAEYVTQVSVAGHATSLETSAFLDHLCRGRQPGWLLDTGSGFSSYVLRRYAQQSGGTVVSVEDSPEWMPRTREFLDAQGVSTAELIGWDDFQQREWEPFDLIFHDLASGELREEAMGPVATMLRPGGVIVFDDAQHTGHRKQMRAVAGRCGVSLYSLHYWTLDRIHRFAMLGVKSR